MLTAPRGLGTVQEKGSLHLASATLNYVRLRVASLPVLWQ